MLTALLVCVVAVSIQRCQSDNLVFKSVLTNAAFFSLESFCLKIDSSICLGGLSKETKAVNEAFHHVKVHFEYDGYKNSLVFEQHFDLFFLYNRKLF